jgi:hypothetical protein
MKKSIFIIFVVLCVFFFQKEHIIAKTTNTEETQVEVITESEIFTEVEVFNIKENTHVPEQEDIEPEEVKEIEHLDISFDVSFLSEVGQRMLNEADQDLNETSYNYTGVSSNYLPSDLMAILLKENVEFVINVNTIDAFGNYYSFDESICSHPETASLREPLDLSDLFKRTAAIECEQDSYRFSILVTKLDYKDPMEEDDYRITTFLIDKEIEERHKGKFNSEYINLGMFEENDPNGIVIY